AKTFGIFPPNARTLGSRKRSPRPSSTGREHPGDMIVRRISTVKRFLHRCAQRHPKDCRHFLLSPTVGAGKGRENGGQYVARECIAVAGPVTTRGNRGREGLLVAKCKLQGDHKHMGVRSVDPQDKRVMDPPPRFRSEPQGCWGSVAAP